MKKLSVFFCSLFLTINIVNTQTWSWSSDLPKAGSDLVVTVKDLDIEEDIHIVGFYFQGNELVTSDINYIVDNGGLKMTLKVPETNWIRLVVKDENNQPVAGDHRDVLWAGAPAKSSAIDFANATSAYYRVMGLKRDEAEVTKMYREAVNSSPTWLNDPTVLRSYYNMAKAAKAQDDLLRIKSHIVSCDAQAEPVSQEVLISSMRIARETGDTILYTSLRKKLDHSYPQSLISQEDQFNLFSKASSLADKILIRDKFKTAYPLTDFNRGIYDRMTSSLVEECAAKEDWETMTGYINELMDPSTKASACNEYAWQLAGEGLENEAPQLGLASDLSARSLMLLTPDNKKPPTMSQSEWGRNIEASKAMYGDTYAMILYKQGKYNEALDQQKMAVEMYGYNDLEMNERYAVYLDKADKKEEFISFAEDMIKRGKASPKMKEMHEQIWTTQKTQSQLYDQYVAQLESVAKSRRLDEVKKMWMDGTPVSFTVKDLDGKTVSLSDFKGKTVVLDFWATWCGPCKASFPGMKNAVEQYAGNKDVVFLFVDTWENGANISERVQKFITENNYPFRVLMDLDNTIVANYKVEGIPTKFIIGPDQKIRFKSVGYSGNNETLVEELMTMIDMVQSNNKP